MYVLYVLFYKVFPKEKLLTMTRVNLQLIIKNIIQLLSSQRYGSTVKIIMFSFISREGIQSAINKLTFKFYLPLYNLYNENNLTGLGII